MTAWKKAEAEQIELWESRMFSIAPVRGDIKKLRQLLRLIEGNGAVVRTIDEMLVKMLVRTERAVVADSQYWRWLIEKARRGE